MHKSRLSTRAAQEIKERLTFTPAYFDAKKPPSPVRMYRDSGEYLHVPLSFGLSTFPNYPKESHLSEGSPIEITRLPDPYHPSVAEPDRQAQFMRDMEHCARNSHSFCAEAATGSGKCLGVDELVLMHDGSVKRTGDLVAGDLLMGVDSTPRKVIHANDGYGDMVRITPTKGRSWTCNTDHILSLKAAYSSDHIKKGDVVHVSVNDYLLWSDHKKRIFKQWRASVDFSSTPYNLPVSAYTLGVFLGNFFLKQSMMTLPTEEEDVLGAAYLRGLIYENGLIPKEAKTGSRATRLNVLAGFICAIGGFNKQYKATESRLQLLEDILYVARSLGFAAYVKEKTNKKNAYVKLSIQGDYTELPCKLPHKITSSHKDVTITGFTVQSIGKGAWRGIVIDGDRQYLLDDFTVTHNTVVALRTAGVLGRTTFVGVHLNTLAHQWAEEANRHLGIPQDKISIIHGDKCDFEGKYLCVGLYQSVAKGKYPREFYEYFGTAIFDELHRTGAKILSQALPAFNASTRIGMSATLKRRDNCERIYYNHLGTASCVSEADALPMSCYPMNFESGKKYPSGRSVPNMVLLKLLAEDARRNELILSIIKKLHANNRQILVVSHLIDHLKLLRAKLIACNINGSDIGLFIGENKDELQAIKDNSRIILATYGMMKEGVDIPRLDAGVDATPSSQATQIIGRIRRPKVGKKPPVWYTIVDVNIPRFVRQFKARKKDYKETKVRIIYNDSRIYR